MLVIRALSNLVCNENYKLEAQASEYDRRALTHLLALRAHTTEYHFSKCAVCQLSAQINPRFLLGLLALCCCALLTGCSDTDAGGELQGIVVYNGKPVFPGSVIMKDQEGATISGNLNSDGEFTIRGAKTTKYVVAVQTQKLASLSAVEKPRDDTPSADEDLDQPRRREDLVPAKFKNANVDIPGQYNSFDTSELEFDFSAGVPAAPIEIKLD